MIGGFLGAGKTTAVLRLARLLQCRGSRVGLITNDQSHGLVDTALLGSSGFPVEEITGGCFCCKFDSLVGASERLSREQQPDVFLAEPVGSCTDLKATVDYPLRRMYGGNYWIAPLSVMVDPVRALRILELEPGRSFSPKVVYVYRKQLEEADIIVINKTDVLNPQRLERLRRALKDSFSPDRVLAVSARQGTGMEEWFEQITQPLDHTQGDLEMDYDAYAEGEALLGWLNCSLRVEAASAFDGNVLLRGAMTTIQRRLRSREIAHLKMTLTPEEQGHDIGVANLTGSDGIPEQSHALQEPLTAGELIINLRAEADPEALRTLVQTTLAALGREDDLLLEVEHLEAFRPSRPTPTHRLRASESGRPAAQAAPA
ncbi:MAG: cobalamin biosynthesis protein P47K [Acidobacteria bacterium]|nr:cobalamin biosynthesis protein P47K [Acidobacteriota bacterium]